MKAVRSGRDTRASGGRLGWLFLNLKLFWEILMKREATHMNGATPPSREPFYVPILALYSPAKPWRHNLETKKGVYFSYTQSVTELETPDEIRNKVAERSLQEVQEKEAHPEQFSYGKLRNRAAEQERIQQTEQEIMAMYKQPQTRSVESGIFRQRHGGAVKIRPMYGATPIEGETLDEEEGAAQLEQT
jgi:hypothetical protein